MANTKEEKTCNNVTYAHTCIIQFVDAVTKVITTMPKVIFEFKTKEEMDIWMGFYYDGGGEQEMYAGYEQENWDYPEIKITEDES